ncbi:hypothetical protein D3C78_1861980 [compost metagenome]
MVSVVQVIPLVEASAVPASPTMTNCPAPYVTPFKKILDTGELCFVQVTPSVEVAILPFSPTTTKIPFANVTSHK